MTDGSSPDLRIGDDERDDALRALGEHLRSGRLDIDEYGERSARLTAARTRGALVALFADLPHPHPAVLSPGAEVGVSGEAAPAIRRAKPVARPKTGLQRVAEAAVPLSALVALALFFTVDAMSWVIFLLPAAIAILVGTFSGKSSGSRS